MGAAAARVAAARRGGRAQVAVRSLHLIPQVGPAAALGVAALIAALPLRAQTVCDGRPIRTIRVRALSLFAPGDPDVLGLARAAGNAVHFRTREGIVRRQLLFRTGEPCDPARLAESARVLRAQPYIREAEVTAAPTEDGGVDVLVVTRDEWSLHVSGRVAGGEDFAVPRLRLADENLFGRAIRLQLRYDLLHRRPAYDADVTAHDFLGRYEAQLVGGRSSVGLIGEERLLEPFKSEFDRVAWRESARYRKEPFGLVSPTLGRIDQPVVAVSGDVGVAVRTGTPGHLLVGGAALSFERLLPEGEPFAQFSTGDSAAAAALAGRYTERRRLRIHLFVGARALRFSPHVGVDAVHATEDVREGIEAGLVVGKSLFGGNGLQRDWFASGEVFAGADATPVLVFVRGKIEARRLLSGGRWGDVLADGRLNVYTTVGPRSVVVLSAGGAAGWHTTTPFQLLLGGPEGIRGYGLSSLPVGRRVVFQGEHRHFLGTMFGAVDVGTAVFVDVGRGWASDAAFGIDTGVRAALGAGLRMAAPRGSRRTYRVDLAVPLSGGHGVEVQLALNQQFGVFRGEPADVARSREQVSSTSVFTYPRF